MCIRDSGFGLAVDFAGPLVVRAVQLWRVGHAAAAGFVAARVPLEQCAREYVALGGCCDGGSDLGVCSPVACVGSWHRCSPITACQTITHQDGRTVVYCTIVVADPIGTLRSLRVGLYRCFTGWADTLFELADAVVCSPASVHSVPSLSLEPVFRRGHGSLYKALDRGGTPTAPLTPAALHHPPDGRSVSGQFPFFLCGERLGRNRPQNRFHGHVRHRSHLRLVCFPNLKGSSLF